MELPQQPSSGPRTRGRSQPYYSTKEFGYRIAVEVTPARNKIAPDQISTATDYSCDQDCIACLVTLLGGWVDPTDLKTMDARTLGKGLDAIWQYRVREAWSFHCRFHHKDVEDYFGGRLSLRRHGHIYRHDAQIPPVSPTVTPGPDLIAACQLKHQGPERSGNNVG